MTSQAPKAAFPQRPLQLCSVRSPKGSSMGPRTTGGCWTRPRYGSGPHAWLGPSLGSDLSFQGELSAQLVTVLWTLERWLKPSESAAGPCTAGPTRAGSPASRPGNG